MLGDVRFWQGRFSDAKDLYMYSLQAAEQLVTLERTNVEFQRTLAAVQVGVGDILSMSDGVLPVVRSWYEESLQLRKEVLRKTPDSLELREGIVTSHSRLAGVYFSQNKFGESLKHYEATLEILQVLTVNHPDNSRVKSKIAEIETGIADCLLELERLPDAEATCRKALLLAEAELSHGNNDAEWKAVLAMAKYSFGRIQSKSAHDDDALESFQTAKRLFRELRAGDPTNAVWLRQLEIVCEQLGLGLKTKGRTNEAQEAFGEALGIFRELLAKAPQNQEWNADVTRLENLHRDPNWSDSARLKLKPNLQSAPKIDSGSR